MNYLGIDHGQSKIGLAKASSETNIAMPFRIVKNDAEFWNTLNTIIVQEEIHEIVVGYPFSLSGESGPQARVVDEFIKKLSVLNLPVHKQDERFTTSGASAKGDDDASAAALILQTFLDKKQAL